MVTLAQFFDSQCISYTSSCNCGKLEW